MSKILITDIPLFTDIPIKQQEIIVGGATTTTPTNPLPNPILLTPTLRAVLRGLGLRTGDLTNYLKSFGIDIELPLT
jgi:hypothetical protein